MFFLRKLRQRVQVLADTAYKSDKMGKDISFYKRIAQVEFNAWQFAEGKLWASLVAHIFTNLRVSPQDSKQGCELAVLYVPILFSSHSRLVLLTRLHFEPAVEPGTHAS
jgi:hypothetical protein